MGGVGRDGYLASSRAHRSEAPRSPRMNAATIRGYLSVSWFFGNSWQIDQGATWRTARGRVVLWDGTVIRSAPDRPGLVETALEVWIDRVYRPDGFYQPATGDLIVDGGANVGRVRVPSSTGWTPPAPRAILSIEDRTGHGGRAGRIRPVDARNSAKNERPILLEPNADHTSASTTERSNRWH